MARTTDSEVQQIIALNKLTTTAPFIDTAHLMVNENLLGKGLSEAILTEIEKYLAAHLTALHNDERQLTEQKLGDSNDKYVGTFGDMLESTQFGQMVKMLDTTGTMASLGGEISSLSNVYISYGKV